MQMRPSRVLKKLRAGKLATCVKMNLADPRATEIAAMCGFDCLWLDMEHVPNDWSVIENQIRSAKAYDVDTVVRVARGSYSDYVRPLEADATGIIVPHVMNLEEAKEIVWRTKFHPLGRRAIDGGGADGAYCMIDLEEYAKTANDQRFVIIQIEDPEVLDDLDEIAKLPGLDMLFFGPADFTHGLGCLAQWDHPLVDQTRRRIAEVARANGKYASTPGGPDNIDDLIDMGYRFISMGADVVALTSYFQKMVVEFEQAKKRKNL